MDAQEDSPWVRMVCSFITPFAMVWTFVSDPKLYVVGIWTLNVMVLRGRAFGRCSGREGGALIMGSVLL